MSGGSGQAVRLHDPEEAGHEVVRRGRAGAGHAVGLLAGDMTASGPLSSATGDPAAPAHADRDTARRVVPPVRRRETAPGHRAGTAARPRILILDEATSALDTASEREVQKALDTIRHRQTQPA